MHSVVVLSLSLAATALSLGRTPSIHQNHPDRGLIGCAGGWWLFVALSGIVWLPLNVHYGNISGIMVEVVSIPLATVVARRAWRASREALNEVKST